MTNPSKRSRKTSSSSWCSSKANRKACLKDNSKSQKIRWKQNEEIEEK